MSENLNRDKFQCHYRLSLTWKEDNGEMKSATVKDPISIQFNVSKTLFQNINTANITIFNLDAVTRESIYQDRILFDRTKTKTLTLEAGYGDNLTLVCFGYVQQCYSERQGTNFVTTIEVLDPDILTQYSSVTFKEGTAFEEAFRYLASQMPNLQIGEFGGIQGNFKSPTVFNGNTFTCINQITGGHTFVDNGVLNTLSNKVCLEKYKAYYISADTGLLDTPKRREGVLEISMLFEPTLRLGQMVEIKSETQPQFDGQYKINGLVHDCSISGSTAGKRTTTVQMLYLNYITDSNCAYTGNPDGQQLSTIVNGNVTPLNSTINGTIKALYNKIKELNGEIPNQKVVGSIYWKDLIGHGNKPSERLSELNTSKLANCQAIADRLWQFKQRYYSDKSLVINSGWRSVRNNNSIEGSAENSSHLTGRAIDFKISDVPNKQVFEKAKNSGLFSYVHYDYKHIHVDVRK